MKEITDCPFCGSHAVYLSGSAPRYYVVCGECGCFGPVAKSKERAKHTWNRSNDKAAMLAALVNVMENRPILCQFLRDDKAARTTWKMAQEEANR